VNVGACPDCDGRGQTLDDCPECNGHGEVYVPRIPEPEPCDACNATGKARCEKCSGTGLEDLGEQP